VTKTTLSGLRKSATLREEYMAVGGARAAMPSRSANTNQLQLVSMLSVAVCHQEIIVQLTQPCCKWCRVL